MNTDWKIIQETGFYKLQELESFGSKASYELFLECVSHPVLFIRIEAIHRVIDYCRVDFIRIFAICLNDKSDSVVAESAQALAKINTDEALKILTDALFAGTIERPHHIANAISQFGQRGFDVLLQGTKNTLPNIRYYSANLLGSTGFESAKIILEEMANNDHEKTSFSDLVSTGARKGLKTLLKKIANNTSINL